MARSVTLCPSDALPEGCGRQFQAAGREVAVFRQAGQLFALDGRCPHQGGPLGEGELVGRHVSCVWHGWSFDLETGRCVEEPDEAVESFAVRDADGHVVVDLP
jgi:nitrite reductase (NADH) small subunit